LGIIAQTTWFVSGHILETYTQEIAHIAKAGCEIGVCGYTAEVCAALLRKDGVKKKEINRIY